MEDQVDWESQHELDSTHTDHSQAQVSRNRPAHTTVPGQDEDPHATLTPAERFARAIERRDELIRKAETAVAKKLRRSDKSRAARK
jgi:hypothetical protein